MYHACNAGSEVTCFAVGDRVMSPFTTCCGACFYCQVQSGYRRNLGLRSALLGCAMPCRSAPDRSPPQLFGACNIPTLVSVVTDTHDATALAGSMVKLNRQAWGMCS